MPFCEPRSEFKEGVRQILRLMFYALDPLHLPQMKGIPWLSDSGRVDLDCPASQSTEDDAEPLTTLLSPPKKL